MRRHSLPYPFASGNPWKPTILPSFGTALKLLRDPLSKDRLGVLLWKEGVLFGPGSF